MSQCRRRCHRLLLPLVLLVSAALLPVSAQNRRLSPEERAQQRAEMQAARLQLEKQLIESGGADERGWSSLLSSLHMEAQLASGGDPEQRTIAYQRALDEMLARFREALPGSAVPDLIRALSAPGAERPDAIRIAYERHPESATAARLHAQQLQRVGKTHGAESVLEKAVADHPTDEQLWSALYQHYDHSGRKPEAEAVAERWRAALPDDRNARELWLQRVRQTEGQERYLEAVRDELTRASGQDAVRLCYRLTQVRKGDRATLDLGEITRCYERAIGQLPADQQNRAWTNANTTLAQLIGRGGDLHALEAATAKLPPERRGQALSGAIFALVRAGDCTTAASLVGTLPAQDIARNLTIAMGCERSAPYLALAPDAISHADKYTLEKLIETFADLLPAEVIEKAVRARARDEKRAHDIYPSLERFYLLRGDWGKRLGIMSEWYQAGTMPAEDLVEYAFSLANDQAEAAITMLENAYAGNNGTGRMELFEGLVALQAEAHGAERARSTVATLLADQQTAADGQRLLATLDAAEGDLAGADQHLQNALSKAARWQVPKLSEQRHWLLAELGDRAALEENLRSWWQHLVELESRPYGVSRDEWLGQRYADVGLTPPALDSFERATFDTEDVELLQQLVQTAIAGGSVERGVPAARRLIELLPERHEGWLALAQLHARAGNTEAAIATLEESTETLERPPSSLFILWADLILPDEVEKATEEQLVAAISVLRSRLRSQPTSHSDPIHSRLSLLYGRLADLADPP